MADTIVRVYDNETTVIVVGTELVELYALEARGEAEIATAAAGGALVSEVNAASSAAEASGYADDAEATEAAIQAQITGFPGAAGQTIPVATRTILKAVPWPPSASTYLFETPLEGDFSFSTSNLSAKITADNLLAAGDRNAIYVPPNSAPTGASGAWIRIGELHPKHFNAISGSGVDHSSKLNAFFTAMIAEGFNRKYSMGGDWSAASGLSLSPSTVIDVPPFSLDFGACNITALASISRMLTIQNCFGTTFHGMLSLIGTGAVSDVNALWTCNTAAYIGFCGNASFDSIYVQGFGYAGIETNQVGNNDALTIRHARGKRIGSGQPLASRSRTANWTKVSNVGSSLDLNQYTEITVSAPPLPYTLPGVAGLPPLHIGVEINGQYCRVIYANPAGTTLRVFPWINSASGASGTLKYHYGAGVMLRGSDANLVNIGEATFNFCSTTVEMGALYGSEFGVVHGEGNGSLMRLGSTDSNTVGMNTGYAYSEGNTYRLLPISPNRYNEHIHTYGGTDGSAKDYDASSPSNGTIVPYATGFGSLTLGADKGGNHYAARTYNAEAVIANSLNAFSLDFNTPATLRGRHYYNVAAANTTLTIIAPEAGFRNNLAYDSAVVTIHGTGTNGRPVNSTVFTPPSGHSINGLAVNVSLNYSGKYFTGPAQFRVTMLNATTWRIDPLNAIAEGAPGVETQGNADVTLTPYSNKVVQRFTTALTANRTVTLATAASAGFPTGAVEGNRFKIVRPATGAFNLNVGTGPLKALPAGSWCEVVYDGSAWQLTEYSTL